MEQTGRFERNQELRRDGEVVTSLGVDVVTGLSVLVYDFPGEPLLKPGSLEIEGVPTVLAAWTDGGRGTLVCAYPSGATLVAPGETFVDDQFVLQAVTLLRETARMGLVHGDLGPGRFLWASRRLYLEGYGVPWKPGTPRPPSGAAAGADQRLFAALKADLRAAARALLDLGRQGLSTEVAAALRAAAADKSAMDATGLQAVVRRLAGGPVTVPSAGFVDIILPAAPGAGAPRSGPADLEALEFTEVPAQPSRQGGDAPHQTPGAPPPRAIPETPRPAHGPGGAPPRAAGQARPEAAAPGAARPPDGAAAHPAGSAPTPLEPDPITLQSDPGLRLRLRKTPDPKASDPGFVKHLPPGATYRAGSLDDAPRPAPILLDDEGEARARRRSQRGPVLLVLLLLVVALGSFLALRAQQGSGLSQVNPGGVRHIVDVRVSPANLPPVSLVVDKSPAGSRLTPGTIVGSVPRRVGFDANGTWVVHAQFQGRRSEPLTLRVPEDSVITIVFPDLQNPP